MPDSNTDLHPCDSVDINLRPVDEVVRRAIVLVTLARRGAIESSVSGESNDVDLYAVETDRFELYSWARRELATQLSEGELHVLRNEAGSLSPEMLGHCSAALIAAETLCWSFGLIDELAEPSFPSPAKVERMFGWAPEPWADIDSMQMLQEMRDELLIAQERERRELWSWRATLRAEGATSPDELRAIIRETAKEADDASLLTMLDGDFSYFSEPVSNLSKDRFAELGGISLAQVTSLNWVCGFDDSWDSIPLFPG
ncbi:MAG: DUF4272 domain-containing protein [Chloroflexia bacterium]|nr:DUF4272 domain-containing protein [Chloroflexia bacterium]